MNITLKVIIFLMLILCLNNSQAGDKKPSSGLNNKNDLFAPPTQEEIKQANQDLVRKCKNGDTSACFELETDVSKKKRDDDLGFIADDDIEVIAETPEQSCEVVGKWKCYNFSKEKGITKELKQRYLKKACDLENSIACDEIGFNCQKGNFKACVSDALDFEEKKNYKKAFELYKKSCVNGVEKGCSYALLLADKIKDKKTELSFDEIMCNQGMVNGCKDLAMHYYNKGNNEKELFYQKKSCDLKDYSMCFSAGLNLSSRGKTEDSLPWISKACENNFVKACDYLKKTKSKSPSISSSPELEKCQNGKVEICNKYYVSYLQKSQLKEAAPFLIAACANDDYNACAIIGELWDKAGDKKQAEGFRQQGLTSANKLCIQNDLKACEMKCGIMANLKSSAYELDECLKISCQKGNSKSCEIRTTINNQINKNNEDHARKRKMIDDAIEEDNRRAELFKGLSKAASQISNSFNYSNESKNSNQADDINNSDNTITSGPPSIGGGFGCGIKPIPKIGCRIGRCTDGGWEQICDSSPMLSCGIKPIPNVGCRIGRCVDGAWEQICDANSSLSCGIKPIPKIGCSIGRCVDGRWEQICN